MFVNDEANAILAAHIPIIITTTHTHTYTNSNATAAATQSGATGKARLFVYYASTLTHTHTHTHTYLAVLWWLHTEMNNLLAWSCSDSKLQRQEGETTQGNVTAAEGEPCTHINTGASSASSICHLLICCSHSSKPCFDHFDR